MTEGSYIQDLVLKLALSRPEISFKLIINNQTKINTAGNGSLKDAVYQLFGRDITANLIPVSYEADDILRLPERPSLWRKFDTVFGASI